MNKIMKTLIVLVVVLCLSALTCAGISVGFSDVPKDAWYSEYVEICCSSGLIKGIGNNKFDPDGVVTIAQMETVCARLHFLLNGGDGDIDAFYENRPDSTFFFTDDQGNVIAAYSDVEDRKEVYDADIISLYYFSSKI